VALLGAGWLYVPANPAIKAPATTLGFNDLHDLAASGAVPTTWLQQNYFGWLGWTLIIIIIVALSLATALTGKRSVAMALAGAGVVSLAVNFFAVKGALTWGQFTDAGGVGEQLLLLRGGDIPRAGAIASRRLPGANVLIEFQLARRM